MIKISIIVPCYQQGEFLDEALESIVNQTYENWECLVINDGSTDNTEKAAKLWLEKDDRFMYLFQENSGLSSARNFGIAKASGQFILPLDADDKIARNYLELALDAFDKNKFLKVVYSKAQKFDVTFRNWNLEEFSLYNLAKENMIFCSAIFKKDDWLRIGGYDINMKFGFEDWEFWINMLKDGGEVKQLSECCFFYRIRENSMLRSMNFEKNKYSYDYLSKKHADFFIEYLGSFPALYLEIQNKIKLAESFKQSKKVAINTLFRLIIKKNIFKI